MDIKAIIREIAAQVDAVADRHQADAAVITAALSAVIGTVIASNWTGDDRQVNYDTCCEVIANQIRMM